MAEKYKAQSIHYLENAFASMVAGDAEKAGEFLWGSMAEALKAVAASEGRELIAHWEIGDYARELAKKREDKSIYDAYGHASYLHSNFYEAGLRMEEVRIYAEDIRKAVGKLLSLI
ncbi:MAG: hypothetical protein IBX36_00800 [Dehalococcoidia bacterium]|nr:hypothetical protein [Dehalococcoidia bacterium]